MSQNMYRIGDYVYFEQAPNQPYQIRRIEELQKGTSGNVEAKVLCYYRRRDIPEHLLKIADQADRAESKQKRSLLAFDKGEKTETNGEVKKENGIETKSEEMEVDEVAPSVDAVEEENDVKPDIDTFYGGLPPGAENLTPEQVHLLRQRELFQSRQVETLSATNIRGKCSVVLLSDVETPEMYLEREDAYFYSLVYDPTNETLLADKGHIRVGDKYQAEMPEITPIVEKKLTDERKRKAGEMNDLEIADDDEDEDEPEAKKFAGPRSVGNVPILESGRETLIFHPHHSLTDREIDQYIILARSVGTFARALDATAASHMPTLHVSAAAASRDITLFHALAILHHADYDIGRAVKYLVPPPSKNHYPLEVDNTSGNTTVQVGGPLLCRDQLEEWSPAEAHIFSEAVEKYNKDFHEVRQNCLGWKGHKDIVEYYYMFKTSDRYTENRSAKKQAINESRLRQVYIPCYNKPSPSLIPNMVAATEGETVFSNPPCESCAADRSSGWHQWGPVTLRMRICNDCWVHWKKRGGLKREHESERFDVTETAAVPDPSIQKQMTIVNATGINRGTMQSSAALLSAVRANPQLLGRNGQQIVAQMPPGFVTPNQIAMNAAMAQTGKASTAFFMQTPIIDKVARKCAPKELFNPRKLSRNPFKEVNRKAVIDHMFTTKDTTEIVRSLQGFCNKLPPALLEMMATYRYRRNANGQKR